MAPFWDSAPEFSWEFIENKEILRSVVDFMTDLQLSWPPKKKYDIRRLINNIINLFFWNVWIINQN